MVRLITETCELADGHQYCSRTWCQCHCHGDKNSKQGINDMQRRVKEARSGKKELVYEFVDNRHY